jgi:hypothetical protein
LGTGYIYGYAKVTVSVSLTLSKLSIYVYAAAAGNFRLGIYNDSGGSPSGQALIVGSGSTAFSGTGWIDAAVAATYLAAGTYWMAYASDTDNTEKFYRDGTSSTIYYKAFTYTALPSTFPTSLSSADLGYLLLTMTGAQIKGYIKATKATLSEAAASADSMSFYSHATGNFYVGIYTDSSGPAVLKWASDSTAASASDWTTVLISAGTPNTLALAAGDYWLAWQWDSANAGPSYTLGGANTGAYLAQAYGAFPDPMTGETLSTENWSLYVTYVAAYITGVVRDANGVQIEGATVWAFKTSDKSYVGTDTSDANGEYSIEVADTSSGHFIRAFKDGTPNLFGTTDDDLVGA